MIRKSFLALIIVGMMLIPIIPKSVSATTNNSVPTIVSDRNRLIEIPLTRLNINSNLDNSNSSLAFWDGNQWNQISFRYKTLQDKTPISLPNNSSSSFKTPKKNNEIIHEEIQFAIPYSLSTNTTSSNWWSEASFFGLNQRVLIQLRSTSGRSEELYLYFSDKENTQIVNLPFSRVPLGSYKPSQLMNNYGNFTTNINSNSIPIDLFTFLDNNPVITKQNSLASSLQTSVVATTTSQTIYDRKDFFDNYEFKVTKLNPQTNELNLPDPSNIIGADEKLVVTGQSYGDIYSRLVSVGLNGNNNLINNQVYYNSFSFTFSDSQLKAYLGKDPNFPPGNKYENFLSVTVSTYTGYWLINAYFVSTYSAQNYIQPSESFLATTNDPYILKDTALHVQNLPVNIPRGVTTAYLDIIGSTSTDSYTRNVAIYVNGVQVYYLFSVSGYFDTGEIDISSYAHLQSGLTIGVSISTYTGQWEVSANVKTNVRWAPYDDSDSTNWNGQIVNIEAGTIGMWTYGPYATDGSDANLYLGETSFYARIEQKQDFPLILGYGGYIPSESFLRLSNEFGGTGAVAPEIKLSANETLVPTGSSSGITSKSDYSNNPGVYVTGGSSQDNTKTLKEMVSDISAALAIASVFGGEEWAPVIAPIDAGMTVLSTLLDSQSTGSTTGTNVDSYGHASLSLDTILATSSNLATSPSQTSGSTLAKWSQVHIDNSLPTYQSFYVIFSATLTIDYLLGGIGYESTTLLSTSITEPTCTLLFSS